jgi:hypothetical protein
MSGKGFCHKIVANYIADAMMPHELLPGQNGLFNNSQALK